MSLQTQKQQIKEIQSTTLAKTNLIYKYLTTWKVSSYVRQSPAVILTSKTHQALLLCISLSTVSIRTDEFYTEYNYQTVLKILKYELEASFFLYTGCSKENFPYVLRAVSLLIHQCGINVSLEDIQGNTPLNAIQSLLQRGLYRQSFLIAKCLLQNSDNKDKDDIVNHVNLEGRSLLSHSVGHGDNSIDLSRLLLNNGAKIFPTRVNDPSRKDLSVAARYFV